MMTRKYTSTPFRILLVEDSDHDQIAFRRALENSDVEFELTVYNRSEDIPSSTPPEIETFDVVVIDQDLPGTHSLDTYQMLKQKTNLPPFVILTGGELEHLIMTALKSGMYDYIIKDPHQSYLRLLPLKLQNVILRHQDHIENQKTKADLRKAYAELEEKVSARTKDLAYTVRALQQEVNDRRETEKALRQSRHIFRSLSLKIVETQESERRQISKELHDSIGASLAAIKFAIEERLQHMQNTPPADVISFEKIIGHIRDTIREVRRISTSLRPSMLDDLGLLATIKWYCQSNRELNEATRIDTDLDIDESEIPEIGKIVIYRVVQEALNNALKHSKAKAVQIHLTKTKTGNDIRLCIKDNGCGFDVQKVMKSTDPLTGYGLKGMQDRADVVEGRLTIDARPGKGTAICLDMPQRISSAPK
jgi:signal transduction histidine kinase